MSRFVVFLAVALTVAASDILDFKKCEMVLKLNTKCCKLPVIINTTAIENYIKDCIYMLDVSVPCAIEKCLGTKLGFATADGTIQNDKWQKKLEEILSDHKDISDHMKKHCFDDRYKSFGAPDQCDIDKIFECVIWQYIFNCPELSNEDSCMEIKDIAPKCMELQP